jgi:flagellar export protein FliJ
MRPFRFRLETVRRLRDHAEQRARDGLARELRAHAALEGHVAERQTAVVSARVRSRDADPRVWASWQAYIERREREREAAAAELEDQETRVEAQRGALSQAAREHRVITRLESKHRERHVQEQMRRQEAELGDIAFHRDRAAQAGTA